MSRKITVALHCIEGAQKRGRKKYFIRMVQFSKKNGGWEEQIKSEGKNCFLEWFNSARKLGGGGRVGKKKI